MNNDELRYPIGKFVPQESYTSETVNSNIARIEKLPEQLEKLVSSFKPSLWDTTYREGGWNARQVVHHLADSHLNSYCRFKWALTEETPVIKVYDEKRWAETPDAKLDPGLSISFLKGHHAKWVAMLKLLTAPDWKREFIHPESKKNIPLDRLVALYAWHGEHHLGHLKIIATKS